jgi:hypothetical protein
MRRFALLVLLLIVSAGCGNPAEKLGGQEAPRWPALEALQQDAIVGVGMELDMAGPQQAKRSAALPHVAKIIDDFANEPIPGKFATPEREAAKKELVESYRKFIEGGSDDQLKELWQKVMASNQTLTAP